MFSRFSNIINTVLSPNINIYAGCGVKLYQDFYEEEINGKKYKFCCKHCADAFKNHLKHSG
ncbi:MAG: hypothetical protein ACTSRZ_17050 [Promethearchaeota archaeon]